MARLATLRRLESQGSPGNGGEPRTAGSGRGGCRTEPQSVRRTDRRADRARLAPPAARRSVAARACPLPRAGHRGKPQQAEQSPAHPAALGGAKWAPATRDRLRLQDQRPPAAALHQNRRPEPGTRLLHALDLTGGGSQTTPEGGEIATPGAPVRVGRLG